MLLPEQIQEVQGAQAVPKGAQGTSLFRKRQERCPHCVQAAFVEVCLGRVILALKATFIIGLSWCRLSDARTREFIGKINKLIYFSPVYKGVKLLPTSSPRNGTSNFDHESDFVLTLDPLDNPGDEEIFEWAGLDYQEYRYTLSQLPMSLNSLTDHVRNIGPLFGQLSLVGYFRLFFFRLLGHSLASMGRNRSLTVPSSQRRYS